MENLSEDEALPNYSYQPQYNLHGLIDITSLQHYQPENQSHHSLHTTSLHSEIQANHLTDYVNQPYGGIGHSTGTPGYIDGQSTTGYPATISPVSDQHIVLSSSMGNSWSTTAVKKNEIGRWSETRSQSQHRVEVGGIGWTDQLNKSMHRLMEVDMMCDTVITTNTNQIKVHKLILMSSSDYLLTLLKRFDNLKMLQIQIPVNITMEALKTFATFLYLGKADLTSDNIRDVALLAKTLKIQVLKDLIVKLSGDQNIVNDERVFDLQPVVLEFCEKRDQCVDTMSLTVTTEQGINTDNSINTSSNTSLKVFPEDDYEDCLVPGKHLPKLISPTCHTYGTRSTLAPKGTPKSRRKTYIEEISKKDQEAQKNESAAKTQPVGTGSATKEVYRGKKSRLLAEALKQESQETPKTRGKAKRKLEAANNSNMVLTNDDSPIEADSTVSSRRCRFRKLGTGNQMTVRPPPKKRAKMELQLSEENENIFDDFDDGYGHSEFQKVDTSLKPKLPGPKSKKTLVGKTSKPRGRRKRNGRWGQSKNLIEIANDIENMAADIVEKDRQFKCNLCGNEFVFSKRCISHMVKTHAIDETDVISNVIIRNKSETEPKICDICGYTTKDQNFCYIHYHKYFKHKIPLPQGWSVYKCDECGKEYFTKFMLKDHKLTHREETPFICESCGQGFKTRTCLNSHVFHRHKEVRKHSCPGCKKTFKTRTQMNVHYRTHTGEKPFRCPHCDYKSTTRGNMRLHLTNKHKINIVDVKHIMSSRTFLEPTLETDIAVDDKEVQAVPMQFITVENAEVKASMNWTPVNQTMNQDNVTTVSPTVLLPVSPANQNLPFPVSGPTYTTYTVVPEMQTIDLLSQTANRGLTSIKTITVAPQQSPQLYMQHSPISPAPAISPDTHFNASHAVTNSPITPLSPNSSYPSSSIQVNSPISPPTTCYQVYQHNLSNSPISPPPPPMSPSKTYQTISSVSPVNLQTVQPVDAVSGSYSDVSQLDPSYNSQHYDSALLQVYYQQQNFYQPI